MKNTDTNNVPSIVINLCLTTIFNLINSHIRHFSITFIKIILCKHITYVIIYPVRTVAP